MSAISTLTMLGAPQTALIALVGTEIPDSRRFIDLGGITALRTQFKCSAALSVRIEYSLDGGASWATLVPEQNLIGDGNPYATCWYPMDPAVPPNNDALLRALALGSGLTVTVNFVELQFR